MRRARRRAAHRRRSGDPGQGTHLAQRRDRAVGEIVVALLHPDAGGARQALQIHPRSQVERPAEENAGCNSFRLRRDRRALLLRRRRARLRHQAAVRGRDHQSRAALQGNRQRMGARGDRPLFHRRAVRGVPGLSAQTRSVVREDRRQAYRRSLRALGESRGRLVRRPAGASSTPSRTRSPCASSRKSARG